jgi:hypothetical protein
MKRNSASMSKMLREAGPYTRRSDPNRQGEAGRGNYPALLGLSGFRSTERDYSDWESR